MLYIAVATLTYINQLIVSAPRLYTILRYENLDNVCLSRRGAVIISKVRQIQRRILCNSMCTYAGITTTK